MYTLITGQMIDIDSPIIDKNNETFNNTNINDEYYIKNYKGGEIESEWQWVKNISIVYTWVDGSDVNFQDMRAKYNHNNRNNSNRYRSADELKYSIRSIEKYMPWFNGMIYIVTCNQIPKWLDLNNSRIKIVNHKDIIPNHIYPTFDSNTIELFFDKIPGITERTYYPKMYRNEHILNISDIEISEIISKNIYGFVSSTFFTRQLIKEYFDEEFSYYYLHHAPFVLYRDLYEPFRQLFKEELRRVCSYRFRHHYKFQILYLYQIYTKYAPQHEQFPFKIGGNGKAKYFEGQSLPKNRLITNYSTEIIEGSISNKYILFGAIFNDYEKYKKHFEKIKKSSNILIFNLNDEYDNNKVLYDLTEFLIEIFPYPSSFEKQYYIDLENSTSSKLIELNKFSDHIIKYLPQQFNELKLQNFKEVVEESKYQFIKKYIDDTNLLSKPKSQISDREREEINILTNYNGEELENEWQWAKSISIVYLLDYHGNSTSYEIDALAMKYSLRSLEVYLPWFIGNIFIVTPNNMQNYLPWLNRNNNRIKIINQDSILPKNIKSAYNRHIVELYLDKIPGITEKFIYLNNYHYFKSYVHPHFFFSNEYFPKYNLKNPITDKEIYNIKENDKPFYNTYSIIKKYFGNHYVKLRYLKDAPYTLYRDLFEPVRQLYSEFIDKWIISINKNENYDLLPLYLISTYNIYGTDQPYYPNYVTGFGKIMYSKLPTLNKNRTIDYYGFDIISSEISKSTVLYDNIYFSDIKKNYYTIQNIKSSKCLCFDITFENKNNLSLNNLIYLFKMLYELYNKKSLFEI